MPWTLLAIILMDPWIVFFLLVASLVLSCHPWMITIKYLTLEMAATPTKWSFQLPLLKCLVKVLIKCQLLVKFTGWILAGDHSVNNNQWFLDYAHVII